MDNEAAGIESSIRQEQVHSIEMPDDERNRDEESRLVKEIRGMLDELELPPLRECCIYRVPKDIRKVKKEAYTPLLVSIGPFHHGNEDLIKSMDQVKKRFMKKLVHSSGNSRLRSCIEYVKTRERLIRSCYSEHIDMNSDDFAKMILVDGCFIIEFLLLYSRYETCIDDDHWLLQPCVICRIALDLILLENQIPFFVLKELFSIASFESRSLLRLNIDFFRPFFNQYNQESNFQSVKHFTDLVLTSYRPPPLSSPPCNRGKFHSFRSSTEIKETGVTFKASSSKFLFDISFINDDVLLIPSFTLDDTTETRVRNLMALELCHYPNDSFLTDYMVFMDCLINTTKDIDLLVHNDIIDNWLGDSKAAVVLFNSLCINVAIVKFQFSQVSEDLNAHYKDRKHKLKATLKREYFHTPWQGASTIAAAMLLILTLIQARASIVSIVLAFKLKQN